MGFGSGYNPVDLSPTNINATRALTQAAHSRKLLVGEIPLPPVQLRAALVAAQLLTYSANYPLSSEATQELFTVFIAQSAHFGPRFAKRVCQVGAVQELIRQRHAKAAGAAV